MKKKKNLLAVAASAAIIAVMLAGTFAWQSISQWAKNEKKEEMNPGARLHDDFNGTNKDVYVENFTDPEDGGMTVYARIRFYEYLEMGKGAGMDLADNPDKEAASIVDDADFDDTTTWTLHNPYGEDVFHDYFEWQEGGSTTYMPTFNMDKNDKTADINGTLGGTKVSQNNPDGTPFDDYVDYSLPENETKTDTEVYDHETPVEEPEQTHTVKTTLDAEVLTMSEWKAMDCPQGEFWVYDTDGWAYWATGIEPGTATGCLLNGIRRLSGISNDYYYSINVEGQFATAGEWGIDDSGNSYFGTDGGEVTNDALYLLAVATGEKYKVKITNRTNTKSLNPGDSDSFKAQILFGTSIVTDDKIVWSVIDNKSENTVITENGNLTVGADETSNCIIIKAASTNNPELYAQYVLYINVPDSYKLEIYTQDTNPARTHIVVAGQPKTLVGELVKNGVIDNKTALIWEVSGGSEATKIDKNGGVLEAAEEDIGKTLTVTATCSQDTSAKATYEIKVISEAECIAYTSIGATETVTIDGYDWYVLAKSGDDYLLLSDLNASMKGACTITKETWSEASLRTKLNGNIYNSMGHLKPYIKQTKLMSTDSNNSVTVETVDYLFLPSSADFTGMRTSTIKSDLKEYTYGTVPFIPEHLWNADNSSYITRTSCTYVRWDGSTNQGNSNELIGFAMCWVNLDQE